MDKKLSSTADSTPLVTTFEDTKLKGNERIRKLGKIKSLGKIDTRSPIISHVNTPNIEINQFVDDDLSLYTSRTHNTIASKIINAATANLYAIRNYYNDFTTIDWANSYMNTNRFLYELHQKHWIPDNKTDPNAENESDNSKNKIPVYQRYYYFLGRWILIVLIGFVFSLVAYIIDKLEIVLIGFKHGYCSTSWLSSQVTCCNLEVTHPPISKRNIFKSGYVFKASLEEQCPQWISWSAYFQYHSWSRYIRFDFLIYVTATIILAVIACRITLTTRIYRRYPILSSYQPIHTDGSEFDYRDTYSLNSSNIEETEDFSLNSNVNQDHEPSPYLDGKVMYTAAGSGVPEVKTILSGFVIRRFLGTYTFFAKTVSLILAIASGMSLGKEGPYVHLAACVGNILSRLFPYVSKNELIQKQILSAASLSGVALAFGSPLGGVLFILEEINHSLPSYQLFQIFFCAIISTLFLKFLDPYGTGNTVLFELSYSSDWSPIELAFFIIIGLAGGTFGALFVKFVGWWPKTFRQLKPIKNHPTFEVILIALLTGVVTFWNPYTKQATTELVLDLATPCSKGELDRSLCPTNNEQFTKELGSLFFALIVKVILTSVTFGLKLPCGIYVPSMVIGALFGRFFAMMIEWLNYTYNLNFFGGYDGFDTLRVFCGKDNNCLDLGIYAMIGAGAFMAGVTRMNITLVTILFEITSSYTYVLPISISIAVANWMGNLIEPNSLYESLLIANDYPFMAPETEAIDPFKTAGEIVVPSAKYSEDLLSSQSSPELRTTIPPSHIHVPQRPGLSRNNTFLQHLGKVPVSAASIRSGLHEESNKKLYIDISESPYVPLSVLKSKFLLLVNTGLLDGCIALLKSRVCVGLLFFAELEFLIDKVDEFCFEYSIDDEIYCKVSSDELYFTGTGSVNVDGIRSSMKHNLEVIKRADIFQQSNSTYQSVSDQSVNQEYIIELQSQFLNILDFTPHINYNPIFLNFDSECSLAHLIFDKIGNRVIVLIKNGKFFGMLHKKTLIDYLRREK